MSVEKIKTKTSPDQPNQMATEMAPAVGHQIGNLTTSVGAKVDDTLTDIERVDLGIDWDSLDKEVLFKKLEKYDDAENIYSKVPGTKHDTYVIHTSELNTISGEKLILKVQKVISTYNKITKDELQIDINRTGFAKAAVEHSHVAAFDFLCDRKKQTEEWDMKHRETFKTYRKQGIAERVVGLAEEIFKKRSQNKNITQTISAKSGQRGLTFWLEKRGFVPDSPPRMLKKYKNLKLRTAIYKTSQCMEKLILLIPRNLKQNLGTALGGQQMQQFGIMVIIKSLFSI